MRCQQSSWLHLPKHPANRRVLASLCVSILKKTTHAISFDLSGVVESDLGVCCLIFGPSQMAHISSDLAAEALSPSGSGTNGDGSSVEGGSAPQAAAPVYGGFGGSKAKGLWAKAALATVKVDPAKAERKKKLLDLMKVFDEAAKIKDTPESAPKPAPKPAGWKPALKKVATVAATPASAEGAPGPEPEGFSILSPEPPAATKPTALPAPAGGGGGWKAALRAKAAAAAAAREVDQPSAADSGGEAPVRAAPALEVVREGGVAAVGVSIRFQNRNCAAQGPKAGGRPAGGPKWGAKLGSPPATAATAATAAAPARAFGLRGLEALSPPPPPPPPSASAAAAPATVQASTPEPSSASAAAGAAAGAAANFAAEPSAEEPEDKPAAKPRPTVAQMIAAGKKARADLEAAAKAAGAPAERPAEKPAEKSAEKPSDRPPEKVRPTMAQMIAAGKKARADALLKAAFAQTAPAASSASTPGGASAPAAALAAAPASSGGALGRFKGLAKKVGRATGVSDPPPLFPMVPRHAAPPPPLP